MNSKELVISKLSTILPSIANGNATYNDIAKMFLTQGWQSMAGNVYQEGMRLSDKIVVKYNIGHGYCHTFLNGVNIYGFDGTQMRLLVSDNSYNCCYWSEGVVKGETVRLLEKFFEGYCRANGCYDENRQAIREIAAQFVDETIRSTEAIGNMAPASAGSEIKALG